MSRNGVLLLGGCGFIGTALTRRLVADGRRVHVIARKPFLSENHGAHFHCSGIDDADLLQKLQAECDTVIHLASSTTPGISARTPVMELENLAPTLRLMEVLQAWPKTHLIFLSSGGTVYGNPSINPVSEDAPLTPLSYHGAGKVAIEGFLRALQTFGHKVTVLRPSNTYGPGQTFNHGFGLIRAVLQHALCGTTLEIWGDGESVRDFVYVEDVVAAIALAADAPGGGTYNVGSGKGHTLNEVSAVARRICGQTLHTEFRPSRGIDVREVILDISKIYSAFGWVPAVGLEEGIAHTWDWLKKS